MASSPLTSEDIVKMIRSASSRGSQPAGSSNSVSVEEIEQFGDLQSLKKMLQNVKKHNEMLNQRITLINEPLTAAIPFTRESLYLFCAYSGHGKSTIAANITFPLWKQGKKVLVLSNEESEQDVLFRIGCLELGLSFNDYKKGLMPMDQQMQVVKLFPDITKLVKVIDVSYKDGLTTKVEGIQSALEAVSDKEYACVLIDYYQLIKYSVAGNDKTPYENLNDLRVWLGQYIKRSNAPVVLFAQLYSVTKRGGVQGKDIDARIKECSAIVEPATVIIEVVPNFEERTTSFIIHKDRFGIAGHKVVCGFERGRYVKINPDVVQDRKLEASQSRAAQVLDQIKRGQYVTPS